MEGKNIELLVAKAIENYPNTKARVIYDNGKPERFHLSLKTEQVRQTAYFSYKDAK